jgi:two-component system cell cycle sensor histidine kinase/response regulator CckA
VQLEGTAVQRPSAVSTLQHRPEEADASQRSSEQNAGEQQVCRIVISDISERKLAEQASKHAEEALRQAQKLEGIGTLASGIAHDFNNLLNAILGQTVLAITKLPPDSPAVSNLPKATKATERATDLTRQLLAYTGKGKFVTENIDLNRLVEENAEFLKVSVPKSTQLRYEISPAPTYVRGDISQLQQVIMNLIINAGEAIGTIPGQITIRTSHLVLDKDENRYSKYTNHPLKQINYALLQVVDSGSGMKPEVLDRIFDPFFTTKFIGRGLGLAAALGIVRGHHGGIHIESEEGKGTRFDVILPLVKRHMPIATQAQPAQVGVVGAGTTLLVIDDESFMIDLLTDIFTEAKFTVMTASNPIEGIELYRQEWKSIAAVILDYSMPGMDGAAAFEQLAAINSDVKVLLCSGYPMGEVASVFGTTRPFSFIQKPYQPATLLDHVRQMISAGKK